MVESSRSASSKNDGTNLCGNNWNECGDECCRLERGGAYEYIRSNFYHAEFWNLINRTDLLFEKVGIMI